MEPASPDQTTVREKLDRARPRPEALARALHELKAKGTLRLAQVRLAGVLGFLSIAAVLGYGYGQPDWRGYVIPLAVYGLAAGLALNRLGRDPLWTVNRAMIPFVDVAAVFFLQLQAMPRSPFPAGVAGWSLGLFLLLIVLSSLSFRTRVIYATVVTSWLCEGMLQREAGVGWGAVWSSGVVLFLAAAATSWAAARLETLVGRLVAEEERNAEQIRELAKANQTIARVNAGLVQAQRETEMLTSLLVHDMKGPLTGVMGSMSMLEEALARRPDAKPLLEDLDIAQASVHRLSVMIGNLLGISRLEHKTIEPKLTAVPLEALLGEVRRSFSGCAAAEGVKLSVSVEEPGLTATLDRQLVQRLLDNLVSNALNFVGEGNRIELGAARCEGEIVLAVRNDGPPVPAEFRSQLFRKFLSLGKRAYHNAGLGLYFCRLVAEVHGGRIALEEEPGWSVSFVARIPVRAAAAAAAAPAAAAGLSRDFAAA